MEFFNPRKGQAGTAKNNEKKAADKTNNNKSQSEGAKGTEFNYQSPSDFQITPATKAKEAEAREQLKKHLSPSDDAKKEAKVILEKLEQGGFGNEERDDASKRL